MSDKIKAILPVLFIAALEAGANLHEVWWRCRGCEKEYEAHHTFCPGCGNIWDADKVLKKFNGKMGHWAFGAGDNE